MTELRRRAVQQIQALAGLDTGGPHLLPVLLEELGRLFAFDSAAYYHLDAQGCPLMVTEDPDVLSVVPLYLDARMQAAERQVARPFAQAVREDFGPQVRAQLVTVPWRRFLHSDYYNVLLRPARLHDCVSLVTRLPGGRATGALKFYRRSRCRAFHHEELGELARLEPYLALALQPRVPAAADTLATTHRALLVFGPKERLLWLSDSAATLMDQIFGAGWHRHAGGMPVQVRSVLEALRPGRTARLPPRRQWRDARGEFVIEARRMESVAGRAGAVAVEIERREPRRPGLLRHLARSGLPRRQFEVACHLTGPRSEAQIAAALGISLNTLVYHRRRLYERLEVRSRLELSAMLERAWLASRQR